jgi:hypothetical protein
MWFSPLVLLWDLRVTRVVFSFYFFRVTCVIRVRYWFIEFSLRVHCTVSLSCIYCNSQKQITRSATNLLSRSEFGLPTSRTNRLFHRLVSCVGFLLLLDPKKPAVSFVHLRRPTVKTAFIDRTHSCHAIAPTDQSMTGVCWLRSSKFRSCTGARTALWYCVHGA